MKRKSLIIVISILVVLFFIEFYINTNLPEVANHFYVGDRIRGSVIYKLEGATAEFPENPVVSTTLNGGKYYDTAQGSRDYATRYTADGDHSGMYEMNITLDLKKINLYSDKTSPYYKKLLRDLQSVNKSIKISTQYNKKEWWSNCDIQTEVIFKYEFFRWVYIVKENYIEDYEETGKSLVKTIKKYDLITGKELDYLQTT